MTGKAKYSIFMFLAIVVNTLPRNIDFGTFTLIHDKYSVVGRTCYYTGQALSYVLFLFGSIHERWNPMFELCLSLALSNLIDELFFDPTHLGINELIFAVITPIYIIYKNGRRDRYREIHD